MDKSEEKENNSLKDEYFDKSQFVKEWLNKSEAQCLLSDISDNLKYESGKISILSDIIIQPAQKVDKISSETTKNVLIKII